MEHIYSGILRLSTIYFYIILKPDSELNDELASLSTIYFYIILKPQIQK